MDKELLCYLDRSELDDIIQYHRDVVIIGTRFKKEKSILYHLDSLVVALQHLNWEHRDVRYQKFQRGQNYDNK